MYLNENLTYESCINILNDSNRLKFNRGTFFTYINILRLTISWLYSKLQNGFQ